MRDNDHLHLLEEESMTEWLHNHGGLNMWFYEQNTGRLLNTNGELVATGYAGGNCGHNPEGVNNHEMQSVKKVGPLPVGFYTFGEVVLKSHLGPFAIPLVPDKDNEMFGRSGFYIHGDRSNLFQSASEGCIILSLAIREQLYAIKGFMLEVKCAT